MAKQVRPATAGGVGASGVGPGPDDFSGGMDLSSSQQPAPFISQVPGTPVQFPSYHGRPVSWFAVTLILAGFLAGGFALIFGPTWWLFWVSLGIAAVGALLAMATGIFDDWY